MLLHAGLGLENNLMQRYPQFPFGFVLLSFKTQGEKGNISDFKACRRLCGVPQSTPRWEVSKKRMTHHACLWIYHPSMRCQRWELLIYFFGPTFNVSCHVSQCNLKSLAIRQGWGWTKRFLWAWLSTPLIRRIKQLSFKLVTLGSCVRFHTPVSHWLLPQRLQSTSPFP